MRISLVVAADYDDAIGKNNGLPWHLPSDLKQFKQLTTGHVLVMGWRTWLSIGVPLPHRICVVLSREALAPCKGVVFVPPDVQLALEFAQHVEEFGGGEEVFVVGGAKLYAEALPYVDRVHLTRVHAVVDGTDTKMPYGWLQPFSLVEASLLHQAPVDDFGYHTELYDRRG